MITTTAAGRAWHYSHNLGRQTAEHNQSKFGRTGGYGFPVDVAATDNDILFVISRGYGFPNVSYDFDVFVRIGKTTIDEDHIGDFARGGFTWPVGIAISKTDGSVFASDEYECAISAFDPDAIQPFCERDPDGEYIDRWGTRGSDPGMLNGPAGIAFDSNDDLHVVDSLNSRVQVFTKSGEFLRSCGSQNGSASSLSHPSGVAVDGDGDVYVTDWGNRRVQIFEPDGEVLTALYGDMRELSKAGEYALARDPESIKRLNRYDSPIEYLTKFSRPVGIDIDAQNRIIVTDSMGRLVVYRKDDGYQEPPL